MDNELLDYVNGLLTKCKDTVNFHRDYYNEYPLMENETKMHYLDGQIDILEKIIIKLKEGENVN